jgi:two-component system, chemotaxis family, CheB/CheR fusion protein
MTRVLLIEDNEDVLFLLQIELEDVGYAVTAVSNAQDGLLAVKSDRPDIIVSDLGLPDMNGFEFIKRVRQMPDLAYIPAIALTGASMDRDIQHAIACGFTAHLTKPVEAAELCRAIAQFTAPRLERKAS